MMRLRSRRPAQDVSIRCPLRPFPPLNSGKAARDRRYLLADRFHSPSPRRSLPRAPRQRWLSSGQEFQAWMRRLYLSRRWADHRRHGRDSRSQVSHRRRCRRSCSRADSRADAETYLAATVPGPADDPLRLGF